MAPIPGLVRRAMRFNHLDKLTTLSLESQGNWTFLAVVASILFAVLVVVVVARVCYRGRQKRPRRTAPSDDKLETEIVGYPDMVEEHHSGMCEWKMTVS
ncbi:hypothetical protein N7457_004424 [Penicillium paradoxum]|uniref:uncharacterized protein n=1 Tax=Penicillium paradoxum TaxID=176176 RepID=UPI002547C41D|nr:uncharacterized protein N7457_004424 [Penicillium paradoxum]KAJ5782650.1 hypothetical protein N7457_004424 [Penicillium paradoxum]